jgi:probable phosphoglycerate mutase
MMNRETAASEAAAAEPTEVKKSVTYLFVRHGEAEGNREHRFIGQIDVPLSDLGRQQAALVSGRLHAHGVSRILSSDLQRAANTLRPLADLGVPMRLEPRLREIHNGEWGGLLPDEIEAGWPDMWRRYRGGEDVPRPGGERWVDVAQRAIEAITHDAESAEDGEVVAVASHGGPLMAIITWALGLVADGSIFRGRIAPIRNASVSTILLPRHRVVGLNDVGHLGDLATDGRLRFLER